MLEPCHVIVHFMQNDFFFKLPMTRWLDDDSLLFDKVLRAYLGYNLSQANSSKTEKILYLSLFMWQVVFTFLLTLFSFFHTRFIYLAFQSSPLYIRLCDLNLHRLRLCGVYEAFKCLLMSLRQGYCTTLPTANYTISFPLAGAEVSTGPSWEQ